MTVANQTGRQRRPQDDTPRGMGLPAVAVRGVGPLDDACLRDAAPILAMTGPEFLPAAIGHLAGALDAEVVFAGEFVAQERVETVAMFRGGRHVDNMKFRLVGTACADVDRDALCLPYGALARYPGDPRMRLYGAEGLIALPLCDAAGERVGVLAAITQHPIEDEAHALALLQLFAGRVGAEMQRATAERELRRREQHLLQAQRVEAIGSLAGNIAHDFNNLLMIVVGYAELLKTRHGDGPELTQLLTAANRATTLTRQLLAFGRRQVMQVQRIDMNAVVTQVGAMLTRVIGAQVHFTTALEAGLPAVEADPGQLEQVLVNLAINARDAMPDGGTLHIATGVEEVVESHRQIPPGRYVTVAVTDTGTGMPPEVLAQMFEPFFTTKGAGGTGLGLSSVYGIVKQSGGFIWCQSDLGIGTTFRIFLPACAGAAEAARPEAAETPVSGGSETILVVDDERGVRELLAQILRSRGYTVLAAGDAKGALELIETQYARIDLVVSDVVMSGMSGTRLVEEIRGRWPWLKLLFVSGYSQGVSLPSDPAVQKVPLLGKPFTPAQLERVVREILDSPDPQRQPSSTRPH